MDEIWKPAVGYEDRYHVSNTGKVKVVKSNKILKDQPSGNGYRRVGIRNQGKTKREFVHRLVATIFIPNPDNHPQVDHIDRKPWNNAVENLRWASAKQQKKNQKEAVYDLSRRRSVFKCHKDTGEEIELFESTALAAKSIMLHSKSTIPYARLLNNTRTCISNASRYGTRSCGYKWKYLEYEVIEGEIWKSVNPISLGLPVGTITNYHISDHARLKSPVGAMKTPLQTSTGYMDLCVAGITRAAHRIVAFAFLEHEEGKDVVNHIDGFKTNNHVSNLEFVTHKENAQHAVEIGLIVSCIPVTQYDLDGKFVKNHQSLSSAGREVGVHASNIRTVIESGSSLVGFQFRFTVGNETPVTKALDSRYRNYVSQYTPTGVFVREFVNRKEAAESVNRHPASINDAIDNPRSQSGGYQWRRYGSIIPVVDISSSRLTPKTTSIKKYTENGVLVSEYKTFTEVIAQPGYTKWKMRKAINNGTMYKGFKWVRVDSEDSRKRKRDE